MEKKIVYGVNYCPMVVYTVHVIAAAPWSVKTCTE